MSQRRLAAAAALLGAGMLATPVSAAGPAGASVPFTLSLTHPDGDPFAGIRVLGSVALRGLEVDGLPVAGLSGLAWDEDESALWAISDFGRLFRIEPRIEAGRLVSARVVAGRRLLLADGLPAEYAHGDAEGLDVENARNGVGGDTRLVVAFERHPRIVRYDTTGHVLEALALPPALRDVDAYEDANRSLESVAVHPTLGVLTGPERPLRGSPAGRIDVMSLDGARWDYPLSDAPNNSLVALEALPDGSLLSLERGFGMMFLPVVITLRAVRPPPPGGGRLEVGTIAVLDSSQGWSVDNFEGLTRLRGNTFFMVSDDNAKPFQTTLLVLLEVLDDPVGRARLQRKKQEALQGTRR